MIFLYIDMSAEAVSLAMIYQINTGNNILHRTHLHYGIHTLYYILCICFFLIIDVFKFRGAAGTSTDKGNKMSKFMIQYIIIFPESYGLILC